MYYHVKCENWFIFKICREDNTMSLHGSKGFSLLELVIVIAIIGIIASLATPPMIRLMQQYQVNSEANALVSSIQELRSQAVLEKRVVSETWKVVRPDIRAAGESSLALEYDFMGRPSGAWRSQTCINIIHTASADQVATSLQLDSNGRIQIFKNKKDCRE